MFDEIIIRQDKHLRGQTLDKLISLLETGIRKVDPLKKLTVIPSEAKAIEFAIKNAKPGSMVVLCSDVVPDALQLVLKLKEQDEQVPFSTEDIPNRNKDLVVENTNVEEATHGQ